MPNNSRYLGIASTRRDESERGREGEGKREKGIQMNKRTSNKYARAKRDARRAAVPYVKRHRDRARAGRNGLPKSRREYRISLPYLIVLFRAPISRGTNLQLVVRGREGGGGGYMYYTYIAEVGTTHCAKLPKTTFLGGFSAVAAATAL